MNKQLLVLVKRILDIILSFFLLIVLLPIMVVIGLLVCVRLGKPVIFKQKRIGLNDTVFTILKFRTMSNAVNEQGELLPDAERLTEFGKFLRATSLDEWPQLWNVLKGELSFVGPRPLPTEYLPFYNDEQRKRHHVKPGITGWAQINGRNTLTWKEKLNYDVWYVAHQSLSLDIKIFFLTFIKVFLKHGISPGDGNATMEKFTGTAE